MNQRVYLDWNATAPLRPEAREAMLAAMDVVGNPSSVHAEGRAAKAIVEKARGHVAALVGCEAGEVVFTSGATEAAALVVAAERWSWIAVGSTEHDAIEAAASHIGDRVLHFDGFPSSDKTNPLFIADGPQETFEIWMRGDLNLFCLQAANSETGIFNDYAPHRVSGSAAVLQDATQIVGKCAVEPEAGQQLNYQFRSCGAAGFDALGAPTFALCSAHKFGGPTGVGCLMVREGSPFKTLRDGGGQEMGRRSGTENVVGIAGFGAAANAARRDQEAGVWERVAQLRDDLEDRLASEAPDLIIFGEDAPRLPNTSCFAVPGWKGETQVMQMDLAGYAISAGSACSSGKVNKASRVLLAMGFDEETASSAIRVSMGPTTTEAEVMGFADTWTEHYRRRRERAA